MIAVGAGGGRDSQAYTASRMDLNFVLINCGWGDENSKGCFIRVNFNEKRVIRHF